ncbi:MAG: COX15/CtaA family protein [Candidatus Binataceae bacterium]
MAQSVVSHEGAASAATSTPRGLHGFAVFAATMTLCLIFVGGLVTSTGSALAVPDWPLAFGHLIPHLAGGVRFEYGHRVFAGFVSILTLALAIWACLGERRRWVRNTALAAFGLIIVQAVLGGITVLLLLPLPIAVAHAGTAQAFFCLMVALALFTNPRWEAMPRRRLDHAWPSLPVLAAVTTGLIYAQILIGAVMRHMGAGLAIPDFPLNFGHLIPPEFSVPIAMNFAHRCGALVVTIFIIWTAARIFRVHREEPLLSRPAIGLLVLLAIQITLGALTILSRRAVIPTTAHVAVGAAVLATSFAITLRVFRVFQVTGRSGQEYAAPSFADGRSVAGGRAAS